MRAQILTTDQPADAESQDEERTRREARVDHMSQYSHHGIQDSPPHSSEESERMEVAEEPLSSETWSATGQLTDAEAYAAKYPVLGVEYPLPVSLSSEDEDEQETTAEPASTPARTLEELAKVLAPDPSELGRQLRQQISVVHQQEYHLLMAVSVPDEVLYVSTQDNDVSFATGDSDAESVRDWESGTGKIRFSRRKPYFFRREKNDMGQQWRRHVKPVVRDTHDVDWTVMYETDEETGEVPQPTVVVPASVKIDEAGHEAGVHEDLQGYLTAGASSLVKRPWETGYIAIRDGEAMDEVAAAPFADVQDWLTGHILALQRNKTTAVTVLEEFYRVYRLGANPVKVGATRDTTPCCVCTEGWWHAEILKPREMTVCPRCNRWAHQGCMEDHLTGHAMELLGRGLHRDKEAMARREAAVAHEVDTPSPAGPAASAVPDGDDPMGDFFTARPKVDVEEIVKERKRTEGESYARRMAQQGASSEEEGLRPAEFCTACGSEECWVPPIRCRAQCRRQSMQGLLDALGTSRQIVGPMSQATVRSELIPLSEKWAARVLERDETKREVRKRRKERHQGEGTAFWGKPDWLEPNCDVATIETWSRAVLHASSGQGVTINRESRRMASALTRGREYTPGSGADALRRTECLDLLKKAVLAFRSTTPSVVRRAKEHVMIYLSKVPADLFEATSEWSWPVIVKILLESESPEARGQGEDGTLDDATGSVTGQGTSAAAPTRPAWKTHEFVCTVAKRKEGGYSLQTWKLRRAMRNKIRSTKRRIAQTHLGEGSAHDLVVKGLGIADRGIVSNELREKLDKAEEEERQRLEKEAEERAKAVTPEQKRQFIQEERKRYKEAEKRDADALLELYEPGSWRCRNCCSILGASVTKCPNFVRGQAKNSWFPCGGSQTTTWGGYVNEDDRPRATVPARRHRDGGPLHSLSLIHI